MNQSGGLPYMHSWQITSADELPQPDHKRRMTDVICLILGVLFGLILFILAVVFFKGSNLNRASLPTDSKGNICALETSNKGTNYPYLYFSNLENPNANRYCVDNCPEVGVKTNCFTSCSVTYYPNYPSNSRLGPVCLPEDDSARQNLYYNSGMYNEFNGLKAISYLLMGVGISCGLSLIWCIVVQCFPRAAVWVAMILAIALLLITALVLFTASGSHLVAGQGWAIFLGIVCILVLLLLLFYVIFHRHRLSICGAFLSIAGHFLRQNLLIFLYIPIFIAITFVFGILLVFEFLAFSSQSDLRSSKNSIFLQREIPFWATFFLVIQAIWGLSFFRDAFNYLVSGKACDWYFKQEASCMRPLKRLFCNNLGSVIGGAFLTGFFYIPLLFISFFCSSIDCCLCNCCDLARSDTYPYIYLTGNSYCPSVRQAQYLCTRSKICRDNESTIAIYAFAARVMISLASVLIIYWITRDNLVEERVPPYLLLGIFFMCLYIVCYFVDIHVVVAEALMICFLAEYEVQYDLNYKQMRICPPELRDLITDLEHPANLTRNV